MTDHLGRKFRSLRVSVSPGNCLRIKEAVTDRAAKQTLRWNGWKLCSGWPEAVRLRGNLITTMRAWQDRPRCFQAESDALLILARGVKHEQPLPEALHPGLQDFRCGTKLSRCARTAYYCAVMLRTVSSRSFLLRKSGKCSRTVPLHQAVRTAQVTTRV